MAVVYSYNTYFLYTNIFKFFGTTCPCCSRSCPFILYAPALLGVWHFLASTANISANFAKYRHLKKIYGFSPFSCKRTIFICFLATLFVNIFRFVLFFSGYSFLCSTRALRMLKSTNRQRHQVSSHTMTRNRNSLLSQTKTIKQLFTPHFRFVSHFNLKKFRRVCAQF